MARNILRLSFQAAVSKCPQVKHVAGDGAETTYPASNRTQADTDFLMDLAETIWEQHAEPRPDAVVIKTRQFVVTAVGRNESRCERITRTRRQRAA